MTGLQKKHKPKQRPWLTVDNFSLHSVSSKTKIAVTYCPECEKRISIISDSTQKHHWSHCRGEFNYNCVFKRKWRRKLKWYNWRLHNSMFYINKVHSDHSFSIATSMLNIARFTFINIRRTRDKKSLFKHFSTHNNKAVLKHIAASCYNDTRAHNWTPNSSGTLNQRLSPAIMNGFHQVRLAFLYRPPFEISQT